MKKRLIGTLLMGALFVSSTSVFVSCKDYDDDINNIVATKADKTELQTVKQELQNSIDAMKTQLSTIEGQITTLTNNKADKFTEDGKEYNLVDVWTSLKPLIQKAANLETSIGQAESAIQSINTLLGGKLEGDLAGKTYKEALELTYAKVAALSTDLATAMTKIEGLETALNDPTTGVKAVIADLQGQVEALNAYKAKVDAIQADYLKAADLEALKTELTGKITTEIEALKTEIQGKIDGLNTALNAAIDAAKSEAKSYADTKAGEVSSALEAYKTVANGKLEELGTSIGTLTTDQQTLSGRVDEVAGLVNQLNVFVRQALRGLVFNMDSYYQGVEATDITVLYFRKYTLNPTDAETIEEWGYNSTKDWTADDKKFADWTKGIIFAVADVDAAAHATAAAQSAINYEEHKHQPGEVLKTTRYAYTNASRVLEFQAKYFMNPSNALVSQETGTVKVVANDKPFHSSTKVEGGDVVQDVEFNGQTTDYCAGISVKNWETKDGMLVVNYDCADPDKIRQITNDNAITVFATQVRVDADTTITSDFAALYKQDVKDIRIAHTLSSVAAMLHNGQYIGSHAATEVNTHCGYCALEDANHEYHGGLHLMQTVGEAAGLGTTKFKDSPAGGFAPQDSVGYTDSLNLNKLVEIHYTVYDPNGQNATHKKMSADEIANKFGLHFEFELTGLYYGSNETSESAHAAIKKMTDPNGTDSVYMLRPQMPDTIFDATTGHYHGTAAPWDNDGVKKGVVGKQDRQTIGRTPIVRVKLIDSHNNIVDYGYIRIKIVDRPTVKPITRTIVNYNAGKMTATQNWCAELGGDAFYWKQTWGEMEYDLHHMLDITQREFEDNYEMEGADNIFTQYYMSNGAIKPCTCAELAHSHANDTLGVIRYIPNIENEQTSVIEWNVTAPQLKKYIDNLNGAAANLPRYIKFNLKATSTLDLPAAVYVCITPSGLEITTEPAVYGIVSWNNKFNKKNDNYWYEKNANPQGEAAPAKGYAEIHANVLAVEDKLADGWQDICHVLDTKLPDVFSSNDGGNANELVHLDAAGAGLNAWVTTNSGTVKGKDLTALTLDFAVDDSLKNTQYTGNNGQLYKMTVRAKKNGATGKALIAYIDANNNNKLEETIEVYDTVATLEIVGVIANKLDSINHFRIDYHNNYIADALLNFAAHDELADNVLNAVVAAKAWYGECLVPLYDNTLSTRFLRPINVFSNDYEIEDASTNGDPQIINLRDLVYFTDWRNEPFKTDAQNDYWHYYNIKAIKPTNVPDGGKLSSNTKVTTNMDGGAIVSLANKTQALDFIYHDATPATPKAVGDYGTADSFGTLVYSNLSNTVQEFDVWVPVTVTYEWGDIYTTIKIHIKKTKQNARQTK